MKKIRNGTSTGFDRRQKNAFGFAGDPAALFPAERFRMPSRVDPGGIQRFGRVNIADTGHDGVIHQKILDGRFPLA